MINWYQVTKVAVITVVTITAIMVATHEVAKVALAANLWYQSTSPEDTAHSCQLG